jgi:hypothetical protein
VAEIDLETMALSRIIKVNNDAYDLRALDNGLLI